MRLLTYLLISLLGMSPLWLTGCSTLSSSPPSANNQNVKWQERQQELNHLTSWTINGAAAIRTPKDSISASLQWQQTGQKYTISLFGPLGTSGVTLTGAPGKVVLETADGKKITAASPEELISSQSGWNLPVSDLFYWIRGLPAPTTIPQQTKFDNYHHLTEITQAGWQIHYLRYTSVNNIDLPNKIFIEQPTLNIKIIINQWQTPLTAATSTSKIAP
jgi:outer membrane lipoprotein LolB